MAASEGGRLRKESLDLQAKLALADIVFRREKSHAERDAICEKVYQAQVPGGLFHYDERIAQVERQFSFDFREALARLTPARRGLSELYGYAPPFPQEASAGYFNDVSSWARGAQNRTAQFLQMEQTYVLAVSLKELVKSQREAGRSSSQWTFEVPEELFKGNPTSGCVASDWR